MAGLAEVVMDVLDESAEGFKNAGNLCMKRSQFSAAIENYKRGLKLDPTNAALNCNLSQAYLNKKEYGEAERYANIAIKHQENYVKGYYRAARAALGRHNVYDSMLYLADGVSKCSSQGMEDLFAMARELSPEFETSLRRCQKTEVSESSLPKSAKPSTTGKKVQKAQSNTMFSGKNKSDGATVKMQEGYEVQDGEWQRKLDEKAERKKQLEEKQKLLKLKNKEITDELERETRELEELKKEKEEQEKKEQEKRERERKIQERREKERKEQEKIERERREQEKIERERKDQEKRERERKDQEKRERERKEKEKREKEKKEAEKLRDLLENTMREGSLALIKGLCRKAVDALEKVLEIFKSHPPEDLGFSDPMDMVVIKYTYCEGLIQSGEYNDIIRGITILQVMEKEGKSNKFPALFLSLGKAFLRLHRFKEASGPVTRGLAFLSRGATFPIFAWPGTTEVVPATDRDFLKEALKNELLHCQIFHRPDAVCFHDKCLTLSSHIIPSRNIFFSDPDFIGFVTILCQENCHIDFHLACWKDFKEHLSIEKLCEKDFLGRECLTPDCKKKYSLEERAVIVKIAIIGPDGEEKSKCECPAPLPSRLSSKEKTCTTAKSPLKRQKKKEAKHNSKQKKRTTGLALSQGDVQTEGSCSKKGSQVQQQYADALSKLVAARENNFGYDDTAPDASKVLDNISGPPQLKQNEEFIYSYFLEIFKKNGPMTIFNLQEHWEANRELLPEIDPGLITHTDLVKFLLDTDMFAVVQDLIGIASDMPKIAAVVESKSDPLPVVYELQFSEATMHCIRDYEEIRADTGDSTSSSSYHSVYENENKEEETEAPSHHHNTINEANEARNINGYSTGVESSLPATLEKDVRIELPPKIINETLEKDVKIELPPKIINETLEKDVSIELHSKTTNDSNNNSKQPRVWKPKAKLMQWAQETFPSESKGRLWEALSHVRRDNGDTLSGLSFDTIQEKLAKTLHS